MSEVNMRRIINYASYTTMILLGLYLAGYQNVIDSITKEYSISSSIMGIIIALHLYSKKLTIERHDEYKKNINIFPFFKQDLADACVS